MLGLLLLLLSLMLGLLLAVEPHVGLAVVVLAVEPRVGLADTGACC